MIYVWRLSSVNSYIQCTLWYLVCIYLCCTEYRFFIVVKKAEFVVKLVIWLQLINNIVLWNFKFKRWETAKVRISRFLGTVSTEVRYNLFWQLMIQPEFICIFLLLNKVPSLDYSIAYLRTSYCVTISAYSWLVTWTIVTHLPHAKFDRFAEEENVSTISPIGPDELPPPYQQAGMPMVTCRVCQAMIDISGKREQHVVKCSECNEATVSYLPSTYRSNRIFWSNLLSVCLS